MCFSIRRDCNQENVSSQRYTVKVPHERVIGSQYIKNLVYDANTKQVIGIR